MARNPAQLLVALVVVLAAPWLARSSRSTSWSRAVKDAAGGPKRPLIYVYEGLNASVHRNFDGAWDWAFKTCYGLEQQFPVLLKDSPYITTNPEEADYFYVWVWMFYNEPFHGPPELQELINTLRGFGPWWDRNQGKDHIWSLTTDQGLCEFGHFQHYLHNSIILEHWGKVTGVPIDWMPCDITEKWPTQCDQVFQLVDRLHAAHGSGHQHLRGQHHQEGRKPMPWPCYLSGKDIVVPTVSFEDPETSRFTNPEKWKDLPHDSLLFFAGGVNNTHMTDPSKPWQDAAYSFGVRQSVFRMFSNEPGFRLFNDIKGPDYWNELNRATFCLAPAGWTMGTRVKASIAHGCIPVIVQDGIKVDWEDELPMFDFALRLPSMLLHRLPELLKYYMDTGRAAKMQENLKCVWRLYWWGRPHGRAFEMTMCVLKARLLPNAKVRLDMETCRLDCGDGHMVDFHGAIHSV